MKFQEHNNQYLFRTSFGNLFGLRENDIIKIRNIRYAISERFQKPQALTYYSNELGIFAKTPACPQNISSLLEKMIGNTNLDDFEVEEATQFLSVFCPPNILTENKKQVIVWIHGGSYELGCGDVLTADPTSWVKEEDVIIVAVSYRLGIFGFLGGSESRPANLGLLDIIEALKWVKSNIANFGGNENNISIFGQSSGADAIAHIMIADGVEGLFKNVILQSAPLGLRDDRQKMNQEFLKKTEHFTSKTDMLEIVESYKKWAPSFFKYGLKSAMPFGIQYGYFPLCEEKIVLESWKSVAQKYNILIGVNDEETSFYLRNSEKPNRYIPKKIVDKAIRLTTEIIYGKPAQDFATHYANAGGNVFLFRIYSKINHDFAAAHAFDLPLLFGNENAWKLSGMVKNIPWNYIHENGMQLRKIWSEFAKTGSISSETKLPEILSLSKIKKS